MKKILLLCILITSCAAAQHTVKQGIAGKVVEKRGNRMPSPGQPPDNGRPVSRIIYVYRLTRREKVTDNNGHFTNIPTEPVAKAKSDDNGTYSITLLPGRYSVFIDDAGKPWTNISDGEGNLNPVEVKKGAVTSLNLTLAAGAVY